ncbi:unnamed protein product [[Candida] boidinii]|uniref:Unnamed protein product n=1 Tax=Candida boidinii TaxID=5477 RepID=A0A9W6SZJ3_CANBO|nr:unnamed protein product [[Candida] boidinii]
MNRTNRIINNNNNVNNNINDEENNKILIEDDDSTELNEEIYSKSYELICDCLPNCPFELNYLQFLRILIKFKLNNFNGSLFLFASHLKHSCEPNCSIDFIEEDKEINDSSVSDNSYYFLSINNLLNSAVFSRQTTLFPQLIPQIKTTEDTDDHEKNKNNNNQFKQPKYLVTNKNYVQVFSNNNKSNANKNNDNNTSKNNGKKQNNKKSKEIKHLSAWNSTAQGIQLKLLKTIDKNETLTINYLENPPLDVNERRLEILKKFNFWCDCPLCNRQSELESDNSNITYNKNNSVSIFNNKSLMMSSMQPKPSTSPQNLTLHSHPRTRRVSITSMTSTNSANSQDKQSLILQQPLSDKENLTLSLPGISSNKKRQNSISSLNQANSNNSNNDNILSNADMNSYSLSNFNISSNEDQEHSQQQSQPYSSILPVPTQQTRKPSFTSSGGSFGEGILKYSRKQISEMLDNLYIDATNNSNSNNGTTGGSVCNSGVFLDAVIDEEDEDGELELELPVPSNFNRGKRKSVRFDDDNIILN